MPTADRRRLRPRHAGALLLLALLAPTAAPAGAEDHHAGYYYPPPNLFETYVSRAQILDDSDRRRRIGFTVELTKDFLAKPYPPEFAVFAKGDDAEKLIIVAIKPGVIDTVYRARALLAELTGIARGSPLFEKYGVEDLFNFYDLCRLMGFKQLTISDGEKFALQVHLE